jgi:hypothetical protein
VCADGIALVSGLLRFTPQIIKLQRLICSENNEQFKTKSSYKVLVWCRRETGLYFGRSAQSVWRRLCGIALQRGKNRLKKLKQEQSFLTNHGVVAHVVQQCNYWGGG